MLDTKQLTHLKQLEAESIHIIREVVAEFDNPVMMYSVGKDSAVMLHLALKAFAPAKLPFPLLHVDTLWKFKEMIEFRDKNHRWDPKNQRPELWNIYNARVHKDESIRVFPLSNWTELDIWQYIYLEQIPIVPLYFAAKRPVVEKDGVKIMVDDERMPIGPEDVIKEEMVRFRTLGCYPLTGAVNSTATTLEEIIKEMLLSRTSERQGRVIDNDSAGSMEKKKIEGYF